MEPIPPNGFCCIWFAQNGSYCICSLIFNANSIQNEDCNLYYNTACNESASCSLTLCYFLAFCCCLQQSQLLRHSWWWLGAVNARGVRLSELTLFSLEHHCLQQQESVRGTGTPRLALAPCSLYSLIAVVPWAGLWSKRRQTKTATSQNGDRPERRQVHGEITKTATNQKGDIVTQYELLKE